MTSWDCQEFWYLKSHWSLKITQLFNLTWKSSDLNSELQSFHLLNLLTSCRLCRSYLEAVGAEHNIHRWQLKENELCRTEVEGVRYLTRLNSFRMQYREHREENSRDHWRCCENQFTSIEFVTRRKEKLEEWCSRWHLDRADNYPKVSLSMMRHAIEIQLL